MNYNIQRLDKRFTYNHWFKYLIGFPGRMSNRHGPLNFTRAQQWFTKTYGWSAEIRQYADIHNYYDNTNRLGMRISHSGVVAQLAEIPNECNPHWSWTNGYSDLRIYVATDQELAFFQLKFPVDQ